MFFSSVITLSPVFTPPVVRPRGCATDGPHVPGQQFLDAVDGVFGDALEHRKRGLKALLPVDDQMSTIA